LDLRLSYYTIQRFVYLKSTASTNEYSTNVSSINSPNHNYCVYTYNQTDGRGQIGRKWYSGTGDNLACSYYLQVHNINVRDQFKINCAVCLALYDTITRYIDAESVKIKWPNDLYIGDKKVAGILIQNQIKGHDINSTIIGLGININAQEFPEDLPNPISLRQAIKEASTINKIELLHLLTINLSERLDKIEFRDMRSEYISKLYRHGELHEFQSEDEGHFRGRIVDISGDGKLMINIGSKIKEYSFREVSYLI
jgi:BirA family biotin operon repressor/biotin-[acetyl-CoA-carboxylase] ligase